MVTNNMVVTPHDFPHNMLRKSSGIMANDGSTLPFTHVEGDMVHNFTHGLSIFDHPNLLIKNPIS